MFFGSQYRQVGSIDVAELRAAVEAIPDSVWLAEVARQQTYKVHSLTQTIPLIFDRDMRHSDVTMHDMFRQFEGVLKPAMDTISAFYTANPPAGTGPETNPYFARIILVRLPAGAEIGSHRDYGASLSRAHRIHLPVVTHPGTIFGIAGVIKHLAPGELWEINNRMPHAVKNDSDVARIHFIFDYVLPGEVVADPDGELVA